MFESALNLVYISKKYQKYFSFGIGDYNLIRKMHS